MEEEFDLYPAWKQLLKVAKTWDYGSVHKHDEVSAIISEKHKTLKYYNAVGRANIELADMGRFLINLKSVGYMVVNPDEYPEAVLSLTNAVYRKMKRVVRVVEGAPVELMTPESVGKIRTMSDRAKTALAMVKATRKDYIKLLK
jgi:hypothetical protein